MRFLIFSTALLFASISCTLCSWWDIEMPEYDVVKQIGKNVEIRRYNVTKWVGITSKVLMKNQYNEQRSMFWTLFQYIQGENDRELEIEMTAPVLMTFKNSETELITRDSNVEMSMNFYVPKINQDNTPLPKNSNVTIVVVPPIEVAVIRFGGWAYTNDYIRYRDRLIKNLGDEAVNYDHTFMIAAGYDSPYNFINRRNEVWLRKTN